MKPLPITKARGVTLVELLLAIILTAMLMVALAAVLDASLTTDRMNRTTADAHQIGRLLTERISRDLRKAGDASYRTNGVRIFPADTTGTLEWVEYRYHNSGSYQGDLVYRIRDNGSTTTYVILDNADDVTCTAFARTITDNDSGEAAMVSVRLTLDSSGETYQFMASGSLRANLD